MICSMVLQIRNVLAFLMEIIFGVNDLDDWVDDPLAS